MADRVPWMEQQRDRFERYYRLLQVWNERMNLTAIVEREEVYVKHFRDSLLVESAPEWREVTESGGNVADVGTGAGFPGVPLAIVHPEVRFVLIDSLQKRLRFLQAVVDELELANVELVHGRAEDLAHLPAFRHRFDAVVARAVAKMSTLVELLAGFAKPGGVLFGYKGPGVHEEIADARRALDVMRTEVVRVDEHELPDGFGHRSIVVMRQVSRVPDAYPRKAGTPQRQPL